MLKFRTFPHRVSSCSAQRSSGSYRCARWDFWHGRICHIYHQIPLLITHHHLKAPVLVAPSCMSYVKHGQIHPAVLCALTSVKYCMFMWVEGLAILKFGYHNVVLHLHFRSARCLISLVLPQIENISKPTSSGKHWNEHKKRNPAKQTQWMFGFGSKVI